MEVKCAIQFSSGFEDVMPEVEAFFEKRGWRREGDSFIYALEAALGGVDNPVLELHKKIRALYLTKKNLERSVPVTVLLTAEGRGMFCEPAQFGYAGGRWGVRISEANPPYFDDAMRLRDKTIATLAALGRGCL